MTKIRLCVGSYSEDINKRLDYMSSSTIYEVFPDNFVKEFTKFSNLNDFFEAIGCNLTSQEDLDKLQETTEFDSSIRLYSDFESWKDMIETALQCLLNK